MSEQPSESGRCFECGADCTQESWCYGCYEFVCDDCARNTTLMGHHNPEDHLDEVVEDYD